MNYQAAIFDVDGVLVDSPHEAAWRGALERLMAGPWRELAAGGFGAGGLTTAVYQAQLAGRPRMAGARAALAHFGLPDPDGALAQQYADAKQARLLELIEGGAFTAFADGLRLLLRLRAAGLRLAAASSSKNANDFLARVPAGDGATMLQLFDANVCGRDFAQGKPHPAIFLTAAAELGLPPARCFVVEDAVSGVQAARAAGMACVGVARLDDAEELRAAGATIVVGTLDAVRLEDL
jgi:beta-phosphoglucomutase